MLNLFILSYLIYSVRCIYVYAAEIPRMLVIKCIITNIPGGKSSSIPRVT